MSAPAPSHPILADMHASAGSPRDLEPPQISALRDTFLDRDIGLWLFATEIFGFRDLKWDFHGPICQLVGHWGETHLQLPSGEIKVVNRPPGEGEVVHDSYRRIMIRIPREYFKTSVFTRANALYTLAGDSNRTIGIFNEKEANAQSWINAICQVVETSVLFQTLFQDLVPKGIGFWDKDKGVTRTRTHKWGGTGMLLERTQHGVSELSIEPHGIGGAAAGKHYTHKILDDIIGLEASKSPAVMMSAMDWVDVARPLERPADQGCEIINHTTWTHSDVYKYMLDRWPGQYKLHKRSLLENPLTGLPDTVEGTSSFPEKIPTKLAYEMKETADNAGSIMFYAQYQNEPKAGRDQSFDPAYRRLFNIIWDGPEPVVRIQDDSYDPAIFDLESGDEWAPQYVPLSWCDKVIILDPAPGKQNEVSRDPKARNGIVVRAVDPWGRRFRLEALPLRDDPVGVLTKLIELDRKWQCGKIAIEEVNFSAVYAPLWRRVMELDPQYADVTVDFVATYPKGRDKHKRIKDNNLPYLRTGFIYTNASGCEHLVAEEDDFPYGETVDLIDADSFGDEVTQRPDTPDETERRVRQRRATVGDRGVTGYGF